MTLALFFSLSSKLCFGPLKESKSVCMAFSNGDTLTHPPLPLLNCLRQGDPTSLFYLNPPSCIKTCL